jgi:hypothetical protein
MTWQNSFRDPQFNGTFPQAHAYVQISLTDGSFLEFGLSLKPASGPHDVERALQECTTSEDFAACLHRYVPCDDDQTENDDPEPCPLTEDEIIRARRLVEDACDAPDSES